MDRRYVQSLVFAEKGNPLRLEEVSAYGIHGHGICSQDQSLIGPNVSFIEKIGTPSVELGCEAAKDIQAGLSLYDGVGPNFTQG